MISLVLRMVYVHNKNVHTDIDGGSVNGVNLRHTSHLQTQIFRNAKLVLSVHDNNKNVYTPTLLVVVWTELIWDTLLISKLKFLHDGSLLFLLSR